MKILQEIRDISLKGYNNYLRKAKDDGKKIIGYFCSYFPEEIVHAAGFVPYRMRACESIDTSLGDIYFSSLNCTFVRRVFDKALRDDFKFLDAIVFLNGCDHTRRMYDNWRHAELKPDFKYMFVVPHKTGKLAEERFTDEIRKFVKTFEDHFKLKISMDSLKESIKLYNRKRTLLRKLYNERETDSVPIKGSEILSIMLLVTMVPVEDAIGILEKVLKEIQNRKTFEKNHLRIFISSGCLEEIEHLELIESCGASIVADNLCLGLRHFHTDADEDIDPIAALSNRYLNHFSCPRMMNDFRRRLEYLQTIKKRAKIDAFIAEKLKFCDLFGGEMYLYRKELKKSGDPILSLERELYGGSTGQLRTRIQAFFEQVRNKQVTTSDIVRTTGGNYRAKL